MKNPRKRLTSTYFMNRYRHFLVDGGIIHLKTDSNFLFTYTTYMVDGNHLPVLFHLAQRTSIIRRVSMKPVKDSLYPDLL